MIEKSKHRNRFQIQTRSIARLVIRLSLAASVLVGGLSFGPVLASSTAATPTSKISNFEIRPVLTEGSVTSSHPCPPVQTQNSPSSPLTACSLDGKTLYKLGAVEVTSYRVSSIKLVTSQGTQVIDIKLDDLGAKQFEALTSRITVLASPQNEAAIVVGGKVQAAPRINEAIKTGEAWISLGAGSAGTLAAKALLSAVLVSDIPGTKCPKLGASGKSGSIDVKCQKMNSVLIWQVVTSSTEQVFLMTSHGLLTLDCSNSLNARLKLLDPSTGSLLAGMSISNVLFPGTSSEIQFFPCSSPFRSYTGISMRFIREQFSPDFSKIVFASILKPDGSKHVGYLLTSNNTLVDVTSLTTTSSFSSAAPWDSDPIFDPQNGDFYFLRNGSSIHRFNVKTKKDVVIGSNSGDYSWKGEGLTVWKNIVAVGDSLLSPDGKYAAEFNATGSVGFVKVKGPIFYNIANPVLVTYVQQPTFTVTAEGSLGVYADVQEWMDATHLVISFGTGSGFFKIPMNLSQKTLVVPLQNLLPKSGAKDENLLISPDGKKVAFLHVQSSIQDLYVMPLESGSGPSKIASGISGRLVDWQ